MAQKESAKEFSLPSPGAWILWECETEGQLNVWENNLPGNLSHVCWLLRVRNLQLCKEKNPLLTFLPEEIERKPHCRCFKNKSVILTPTSAAEQRHLSRTCPLFFWDFGFRGHVGTWVRGACSPICVGIVLAASILLGEGIQALDVLLGINKASEKEMAVGYGHGDTWGVKCWISLWLDRWLGKKPWKVSWIAKGQENPPSLHPPVSLKWPPLSFIRVFSH